MITRRKFVRGALSAGALGALGCAQQKPEGVPAPCESPACLSPEGEMRIAPSEKKTHKHGE